VEEAKSSTRRKAPSLFGSLEKLKCWTISLARIEKDAKDALPKSLSQGTLCDPGSIYLLLFSIYSISQIGEAEHLIGVRD